MKRKKRIGTVGKAIGCVILLFVALFPIYWLVAMAIRPTSEMTGHISIIPHALTGSHFIQLFREKGFSTAIVNSLQTTIGSLALSLIVGICAAYVLARRRFRFGLKKPMTYWILLVRVLPPVAFTIPLYTMFSKVGILNTKLPVLLACVLINVPLIIWFLIGFFQDLPEEIEESAKVDGATEWQLFRKIVLPLVAPGIAAVAMLSFMYAWNEYTYTVIFTRTPANNTVPLALSLLNTEDNLTNFGSGGRRRRGLRHTHHPVCDLCTELLDFRTFKRCCQGVTKIRTQHLRLGGKHDEKSTVPDSGAGHGPFSGCLRRQQDRDPC